MSEQPTDDKATTVLRILNISEPGAWLHRDQMIAIARKHGLDIDDIRGGVQYAPEEGWLETSSDGRCVRLSEAGSRRI